MISLPLGPVIAALGTAVLGGTLAFVYGNVHAAGERLAQPSEAPSAPIADHTDAPYCTPQFREVLQRVVSACGLVGTQDRRGCAPVDVRAFAHISDEDFNALFSPLEQRGAIVMFDHNSDKLDPAGRDTLLRAWEDRRGARYFFVVARASKSGTADGNRALSHRRANSVKFALEQTTQDGELDDKVGLLWLGSQYAQLPQDYCQGWTTSRTGKACSSEAINRSAFVSWVDCRL